MQTQPNEIKSLWESFFLFVTFSNKRSEGYFGFFNNCYTITKKTNTDKYSCITMEESSIMANTVFSYPSAEL